MIKTTIPVTALRPFKWKGQQYARGQSVALAPLDAIVLSQKKIVTLARKNVAPVVHKAPEPPPPPPEPIDTPKPRRRYRRRDLQAEETTSMQPETVMAHLEPSDDDDPDA